MKIKNPILNSIIYAVIFYVLFLVVTVVISVLCNIVGITDLLIISFFTGLVLFLLYLLIYRKKFKKLITPDKFKHGLIWGLPILLLMFLPIVVTFSFDFSYLNLSVYGICYAVIGGLGPGLAEETIFRGAIINSFMEKLENEKFIPLVILLSALFFSLIHSINLLIGADVSQTILQLIYTFAIGSLLAAIYLRTGNILAVIFWHSFIDFFAFLNQDVAQTGGVLTTSIDLLGPSQLVVIISSIVLVVIAFYYVRPKKYDEIMEVWNLKKL